MCTISYFVAHSKKKKADDKRKRHHHTELFLPDKRKKPNLESHLEAADNDLVCAEEDLSEQDKSILRKWKKLQQSTKPFVHPIRKLTKACATEDSCSHQDQLLKHQSEQIAQLQRSIAEQQRVIQEQQDQIRQLQDRLRSLNHDGQAAAIKLPEYVETTVQTAAAGTTNPLVILPKIKPPSTTKHNVHSIETVLRVPPAPPSYHVQTRPPQHLTTSASTLTVNQTAFSHAAVHHSVPHNLPDQPSHHVLTTRPAEASPQVTDATCTVYLQHVQSSVGFLPSLHVPKTATQPSLHLGTTSSYTTGTVRSDSRTNPMVCNVSYSSPVHHTTFQTVLPEEPHNVTLSSPRMSTLNEPFDDLDSLLSIAGLPTGNGAGYGVGVMEENITANHSAMDFR